MENKPFRFLLSSIESKQFATFSDVSSGTEVKDFEVRMGFNVSPDDHHIGVLPYMQFENAEGEDLVVIEVEVSFKIHDEDWVKMIEDDGKTVRIPISLAQHLAVIAVGTGRGILHEKIRQLPLYNNLMWPIVNLTEIIEEDVVFNIWEDQ